MSWTKRQFVTQAYEEIGYAGYVYDLEPEQLQAAMRRLDSMLATWNGRGVYINYPLPSSPGQADLDDETGVPDWANEAIYLNLAVRIGPTVGKVVSMETKAAARTAYNQVLQQITMPNEMRFPERMPSGAGNKPWRDYGDPFLQQTDDNVLLPPSNEVEFDG